MTTDAVPSSGAPPLTPKPPTINQAHGIDWCQKIDGVVHVATFTTDDDDGAYLITLTERDGVQTCFASNEVQLADLRAWRDRRTFGLPVCQFCEDDVSEWNDTKEMLL